MLTRSLGLGINQRAQIWTNVNLSKVIAFNYNGVETYVSFNYESIETLIATDV